MEFQEVKELISLIKYYLENDSERQRIAEAGYLRCHREHTYDQRLKEILKAIV